MGWLGRPSYEAAGLVGVRHMLGGAGGARPQQRHCQPRTHNSPSRLSLSSALIHCERVITGGRYASLTGGAAKRGGVRGAVQLAALASLSQPSRHLLGFSAPLPLLN